MVAIGCNGVWTAVTCSVMDNQEVTVKRGSLNARVRSADGVAGILLRTFDGRMVFRVYHPRTTQPGGSPMNQAAFTDYEVRHDDLSVVIAHDALAAFYECPDGVCLLDHAPEVLGLVSECTASDSSPPGVPSM